MQDAISNEDGPQERDGALERLAAADRENENAKRENEEKRENEKREHGQRESELRKESGKDGAPAGSAEVSSAEVSSAEVSAAREIGGRTNSRGEAGRARELELEKIGRDGLECAHAEPKHQTFC